MAWINDFSSSLFKLKIYYYEKTFSCEKDAFIEQSEIENKILPIVEVDYMPNGDQNSRFLLAPPPVIINVNELDVNCDLSNVIYDDFTTNVNWYHYDSNDRFTPNTSIPNTYGEFPSIYFPKALQYVLNNEVLPMQLLPFSINPVTGLPYSMTIVQRYYTEYQFWDRPLFNPTGPHEFEFLVGSMTPAQSNELRDIIACRLIEEAAAIDATAFIMDLGIVTDARVDVDNPLNSRHIVQVYVQWAYDR